MTDLNNFVCHVVFVNRVGFCKYPMRNETQILFTYAAFLFYYEKKNNNNNNKGTSNFH